MNWEPVDYIVASIIGLLALIVVVSSAMRALGMQEFSDSAVQAVENFMLSSVAIISLYVGSRLNKKDE